MPKGWPMAQIEPADLPNLVGIAVFGEKRDGDKVIKGRACTLDA